MKSVSEKSTQFSVGGIGTYVLAMLEEEGEEEEEGVGEGGDTAALSLLMATMSSLAKRKGDRS